MPYRSTPQTVAPFDPLEIAAESFSAPQHRPEPAPSRGMFDDLIPGQSAQSASSRTGVFDDLIPQRSSSQLWQHDPVVQPPRRGDGQSWRKDPVVEDAPENAAPWRKYQKQSGPWDKYKQVQKANSGLQAIRERFPQYDDIPDQDLLERIYQRHYSDLPRADFDRLIRGLLPGEGRRGSRYTLIEDPPAGGRYTILEDGRRDPAITARREYGLDLTRPDAEIRAQIDKLPETEKKRAHDIWADHRVQRMYAGTGFTPQPELATGIPIIGSFLDEAQAAIQGVVAGLTANRVGRPYDEALAGFRAHERAATAANPIQSTAGKLATGIATGGPLFGRLPLARTLPGRVVQGSTIGAGVGAAEGFGHGEGSPGRRVETAHEGASVGAGIGAVLPIGSAGVSRLYGAAADLVGPTVTRLFRGPEAAADRILAKRIWQEGSSPAAKQADLDKGQNIDARMAANSRAALPETLADTSDAMRRLTGSLYRQGGEAGNFSKEFLENRQRGTGNPFSPQPADQPGQMGRVLDATQRAMLLRTANSARKTERQIIADQKQEADNLYRQAYENSQPFDLSGVLTGMAMRGMQYPDNFRQVINKAIQLFTQPSLPEFAMRERTLMNRLARLGDDPTPRVQTARMRILDQLFALQSKQGLTQAKRFPVDNIERFDAAKKALDDLIDEAGKGTNLGRELTQLKHELLKAVHRPNEVGQPTANAIYQQARESFGSAAENREAIQLGRDALKDGSEVSVEHFLDLTKGQQQLFRIGFLESLRRAFGPKHPGDDITRLFQEQRVRELLRAIIPRSQSKDDVFFNRPERFGNLMDREARMVQTRNAVLGNSATQQRQMDDLAFAGDALASMWNRFRSSPTLFNMGIEAVGAGIQKVFGYNQRVALAMARSLLEADPAMRNQILQRLAQRGGPGVLERFAIAVDRSANALTAATAGPLMLEDQRPR